MAISLLAVGPLLHLHLHLQLLQLLWCKLLHL